MAVGSICRSAVTVVDVFGTSHEVARADAADPSWTMFSTSAAGTGVADFFLLPATVGLAAQDGEPLEEVHFLRDEVANLVWAVEDVTESNVGKPLPGADRGAPPPPEETPLTTPLRYRIQTYMPYNWIPFEPVQIPPPTPPGGPPTGEVALEKAAMLVPIVPPPTPPAPPEEYAQVQPWGKVLNPQAVAPPERYRVREEEVPREGTQVARLVRWSRWLDGSTHVWVSRRRSTGRGEGSSGLRFDLAVQKR
jgi:hypothetical protein